MKKIDTFYLSDKQIAQLKSKKTKKHAARGGIFLLTALASILTIGFLPNFLQKLGLGPDSVETIKTILAGIAGTGVIGGAVSFNKASRLIDDRPVPEEIKKSVDRSEYGYHGKFK